MNDLSTFAQVRIVLLIGTENRIPLLQACRRVLSEKVLGRVLASLFAA